ncbi:MAG: class I SAM-dependent methyltransferase [Actinomycetia bacterium]|nr:class I SAM-dependent methyltransferase [Actinomycetes bacterium]MCP5031581.1 class I SAM-dependent methyltransferase [Actinomycetes bacterium]
MSRSVGLVSCPVPSVVSYSTKLTTGCGRLSPMVPAVGDVALTGLCQLADFVALRPWMAEMVPFGRQSFGPQFPVGREYRKHWEVAQAGRALAATGCLTPGSDILGVGAGNEPTIFWLTNYTRRVFATDLYLSEGWEESANSSMLISPRSDWFGEWNPRRLVAQHMDGRDLRYEDNSFDGAFSSSSIEHFGDWADVAQAVSEVYRVLRPGAVFSVSTEYRLAGPSPGLPGILMFDRAQLTEYVIEAMPWEVVGPANWDDPRQGAPTVSFDEAAAEVRSHMERHGELVWSELDWPEYPHLVLGQGDLEWVSVHLTLRKPGQ